MYDRKVLNGGRLAAPQAHRNESLTPSLDAAVRPSEAELLRVIERALEEQRRARAIAEAPLSSRIEAILSPRFEAANDTRSAAVPAETQPAIQRDEPVLLAANLNHVPAFEPKPAASRAPSRPVAFAFAGLMLGAVFPLVMPQAPLHYAAETVLHIAGEPATRPASTALAAKKLVSAPAIAATVSALKLDRDPEFAGGQPNAVGVVIDLLSGNGAAADASSRAEATVAAAVEATPDVTAGSVRLTVSTSNAEKSRQIASRLSGMLTAGSSEANNAGPALQKAYDQARAELDAFTATTGEGNVKVAAGLQQQINQLDADLKVAEQHIALSKERADRLKATKPNDVVDGVLPAEMLSPALQDIRDRYSVEKAALSQLSIDLGPRHPKLLTQQATVDGLRDKLSQELSLQVKQASADAKAAVDARRKLSDERNGLIAQSRDTGVDLAKLTELRDKAEAAKSRLTDVLPSADIGIGTVTVQTAPKVTALQTGASSPLRSAIGGAVGLLLGIAASIFLGLLRKPETQFEADAFPAFEEHPAPLPEVPAPPAEIVRLRAELAELRSKVQNYAATSR